MSAHAAALTALRSWHPPNAVQSALADEFATHLGAHSDGLQRSCFPRHLTAGAVVVSEDGEQVLLNLHRKARRWFHFGGHIEAVDRDLATAALRESREESGIDDLRLSDDPVQLSAHPVRFCDPRGEVIHLDVRYLAVAATGAEPTASTESESVRWFGVDALPTEEPDMVELVALAVEALRAGN